MLVRFARPWFNGKLYKPSKFGVDVPDELRNVLPEGAEVIETPPPPKVTKVPKQRALSELAKKQAASSDILSDEDE